MNTITIVIDKCSDCKNLLHHEHNFSRPYACARMPTVGLQYLHREVSNIRKIPDWCPRKDKRN